MAETVFRQCTLCEARCGICADVEGLRVPAVAPDEPALETAGV